MARTKAQLEERVEELESEVADLEGQLDGDAESEMADQLESLAVALDGTSPSLPQTPAQWARCLRQIAKGGDWQNGTWK